MALSEEKLCSVGCKWMYTFNCLEAKKFIPVKNNLALTNGFQCFSRNWKNPLLWSHYADKHRGICLGFDVQDDVVKPVTYTEDRLEIDANDLADISEEDGAKLMEKLLWTKYLDWKYEEEVRAYASLEEKDASTGLYYLEFGEKLKLSEIIAGPLCSIETKMKIQEAIGRYSDTVEVVQARLAYQSFKVVPDQRGFRVDE